MRSTRAKTEKSKRIKVVPPKPEKKGKAEVTFLLKWRGLG